MPSLLSLQVISALDGPSTASDSPPVGESGRAQVCPVAARQAPSTGLVALLTFPSVLGDDREGGGLVHHAVAQTWSVGADLAAVDGIHVELQGAPWVEAGGLGQPRDRLPVPASCC